MKSLPIIANILLIIFTINLSAQTPVGFYFDADHNPIEGYLDHIDYSPENLANILHKAESYEKGAYYDNEGNRKSGLILYTNKKFWYKPNESDEKVKLKPENVSCLTLGVDSFIIINNFHKILDWNSKLGNIPIKNTATSSLKKKPEFVKFLTKFGEYTFVQHFEMSHDLLTDTYTSSSKSYLVNIEGSDDWVLFPTKRKKFREMALEYFGHIPHLKKKITNKEYDYSDILTLIKTCEYFHKYKNNKNIYYDKYWQETINIHSSKYHAKITDKQDSIWTVEYFEDDKKIINASYSSFYPHIKNGDFIFYYRNGKPRKFINYFNDKPQEVKTYFNNEKLHHHYRYIKEEAKFDSIVYKKYIEINDVTGELLIDNQGNAIEYFFDKESERKITITYKNHRLHDAHIIINKKKVHLFANPDFKFALNSMQKKLNEHIKKINYDNAVSVNAQGIILVSLIIDKDGHVSSFKILNNSHADLFKIIFSFLNNTVAPTAPFPLKFKRNKYLKEKISYEVVIPFNFTIDKFYRDPYQYYFHHNMWMHNHMMFNQNNIPNINIPTMYPGY